MGVAAAMVLAAVQTVAAVPELADRDVRAVEVTRDGVVWLGVRSGGLVRIVDGRLEWARDFPLAGAADLHEDRSGLLWAAGPGGAAVRRDGAWRHIADPGGLGGRVAFRISEEPGDEGGLWFATSAGAARLHDGAWTTVRPGDGLPHAVVHAVLAGEDGTTWFACREGLARIDGGGVTVYEPETNFRAALRAPDGTAWFGTSSGFRAWDGRQLVASHEEKVVFPVLVTGDGSVWAGSAGFGLFRHAADAWRAVPVPAELAAAEIFDLAEAPSGTIWMASSRGAWTLRPEGAP